MRGAVLYFDGGDGDDDDDDDDAAGRDKFGDVALLSRRSRAYGATVRSRLTPDVTHVLLERGDGTSRLPSITRRRAEAGTADGLVVVRFEWLRECLVAREPWSSFPVCMRHMVGGGAAGPSLRL